LGNTSFDKWVLISRGNSLSEWSVHLVSRIDDVLMEFRESQVLINETGILAELTAMGLPTFIHSTLLTFKVIG